MDTYSQLKAIRQQMFDDLNKQPEYRAIRAMKRFIEEMSEIYGVNAVPEAKSQPVEKPVATRSIERRVAEGPTEAVAKRIRAYAP